MAAKTSLVKCKLGRIVALFISVLLTIVKSDPNIDNKTVQGDLELVFVQVVSSVQNFSTT